MGVNIGMVRVVVALVAGLGWGFSRRRCPALLQVLSIAALALAIATLLAEGVRWQLVPWQGLALAVATAAALRRWRPGHSRRWRRVAGRVAQRLLRRPAVTSSVGSGDRIRAP